MCTTEFGSQPNSGAQMLKSEMGDSTTDTAPPHIPFAEPAPPNLSPHPQENLFIQTRNSPTTTEMEVDAGHNTRPITATETQLRHMLQVWGTHLMTVSSRIYGFWRKPTGLMQPL